MKYIFLILSVYTYAFTLAQNNNTAVYLNSQKLTYDSVQNVIFSTKASLQEKNNILMQIKDLRDIEKLTSIFEVVLRQAKEEKNDVVTLNAYWLLANLNMVHVKHKECGLYLDSAFLLEPQVKDPESLRSLYTLAGIYYQSIKVNRPKSHAYFYKAVDMSEKIEHSEMRTINILYNLWVAYVHDKDMVAGKSVIDKMNTILKNTDDPRSHIMVYTSQASYYLSKAKETAELNIKESLLDSAKIYYHRILDIDKKNTEERNDLIWKKFISGSYHSLASIESESSNPDWGKVINYIKISEEMVPIKDDPNDWLRVVGLKVQAYCKQEKFAKAIETGKPFIEFVEAHKSSDNNSYDWIFRDTYPYFAIAYMNIGDYKNAFKFKDLENEINKRLSEESKFDIVKEIEIKYDVKIKEQEIATLKERTLFQERIRSLFIGIFILLISIIAIVIYLARMKRKAAMQGMEILQMEKDEIELQIHLKEEQAKIAHLEKYEALSEVRLVKLQVEGKEEELKSLMASKSELDQQIEIYSLELKKYEDLMGGIPANKIINPLIEEIADFINNKIKDNKEDYLLKLERINNNFIKKLSEKNISKTYIKYCIYFVIDMDMKDIARFFNVEVSSVHVMRYRLKKKLQLSNEMDLNFYLLNLL